jgi:hypothetical protein
MLMARLLVALAAAWLSAGLAAEPAQEPAEAEPVVFPLDWSKDPLPDRFLKTYLPLEIYQFRQVDVDDWRLESLGRTAGPLGVGFPLHPNTMYLVRPVLEEHPWSEAECAELLQLVRENQVGLCLPDHLSKWAFEKTALSTAMPGVVRHLHLGSNLDGAQVIEWMARFTQLHTLSLNGAHEAHGRLVQANPNLERLFWRIMPEQVSALEKLEHLETLVLWGSPWTPEFIASLANIKTLRHLRLQNEEKDRPSELLPLKALMPLLRHPTLETLVLGKGLPVVATPQELRDLKPGPRLRLAECAEFVVALDDGASLNLPPTLLLDASTTLEDDIRQCRRWLTELGSDDFATRERAHGRLVMVGVAGQRNIRGWKTNPGLDPEMRARLAGLDQGPTEAGLRLAAQQRGARLRLFKGRLPVVPDDAPIRKKMANETANVYFEDKSLGSALRELTAQTGVPCLLDPVLESSPNIDLRGSDLHLDRALHWICKLAELEYVILEDAVWVTSKDQAAALKTRTYAIKLPVDADEQDWTPDDIRVLSNALKNRPAFRRVVEEDEQRETRTFRHEIALGAEPNTIRFKGDEETLERLREILTDWRLAKYDTPEEPLWHQRYRQVLQAEAEFEITAKMTLGEAFKALAEAFEKPLSEFCVDFQVDTSLNQGGILKLELQPWPKQSRTLQDCLDHLFKQLPHPGLLLLAEPGHLHNLDREPAQMRIYPGNKALTTHARWYPLPSGLGKQEVLTYVHDQLETPFNPLVLRGRVWLEGLTLEQHLAFITWLKSRRP